MAVEEMRILNLVGQLKDYNSIMREIILSNNIQLMDAYKQIDENKFSFEIDKNNIDEIVDMSNIEVYKTESNIDLLESKLNSIIENMDVDFNIDYNLLKKDYDFSEINEKINKIYDVFKEDNNKIIEIENEIDELKKMLLIKGLEKIDFDFKKLYEMDEFEVRFGKMTMKNRNRLSMNYENITSAIMHIENNLLNDLYLVISPKSLKNETNRILRSVYFEEIILQEKYLDKPKEMVNKINNRINLLKDELSKVYKKIGDLKKNHYKEVHECYTKVKMQKKIIKMSENIAATKHFFYLSAWIPISKEEEIKKVIESKIDNVIMETEKPKLDRVSPPTKLRNNWISRPFESLVNMYGVPSYSEVDPTAFFAITYMVLFGAMFGDLGQGFVFLFFGLFLKKVKNKIVYGGLLSRVGISSMIFGFFYDSFFGYEHIISNVIPLDIFLRPIENIQVMLTSAILLGIFLLYVGFGYSIYNKLKNSNIKEGIFGRNGVVGLILYTSILIIMLERFTEIINFNTSIFIFLSIIMIFLLVFKEPIVNKINKKERLYSHSAGEYYVESGFELLETFLSMLSNTVSFIRVGAFALNHVGLFIAFHTMAKLIGSTFGNISMFFIGNLIIIFLEGLIVFIQGLRLMYYEIFSKYYKGDGYRFNPSSLE